MQITLGWDYWNKKRHDLRRDMLQLHYYLLLEAEMTVQHLLPPPVMRRWKHTRLTQMFFHRPGSWACVSAMRVLVSCVAA